MSANILLIILTCIVSYYGFNNRSFFEKLKHFPYQEQRDKSFSRLLSAGFLHGSWLHLLINMYVLFHFGEEVENHIIGKHETVMGRTYYTICYLAMIILANIPTFLKNKNNPNFASIGASGAVSGIIFMFILMEPWRMLGIMFVIPCPAIIAGVLYLIYSSWASKNSNDNIDHDAHFYGAICGIIFMILLDNSIIDLFIKQISNVPKIF